MKNKENYCKFVIQFNSILKIISLIALLFILLFSISCSSNEDPNEYRPKDRDGIGIPKEFFGHYIVIGTATSKFGGFADVELHHTKGTHMFFGGRGLWFPQEATYLGNNTWRWWNADYVNFKLNDKGQRILTASNSSVTSKFVHDKDK